MMTGILLNLPTLGLFTCCHLNDCRPAETGMRVMIREPIKFSFPSSRDSFLHKNAFITCAKYSGWFFCHFVAAGIAKSSSAHWILKLTIFWLMAVSYMMFKKNVFCFLHLQFVFFSDIMHTWISDVHLVVSYVLIFSLFEFCIWHF